ncbi:hypothetical protein UlMin_044449 [Ulmus minor]
MCDYLTSSPISLSVAKFRQLGLTRSNRTPKIVPIPNFYHPNRSNLPNDRSFPAPGVFGSENYGFRAELGFKEEGEKHFDFESNLREGKRNGRGRRARDGGDGMGSQGPELFELRGSEKGNGRLESEDLVRVLDEDDDGVEEVGRDNGGVGLRGRRRRQMTRRSSLLAKQVISIGSALSLGFVSQLWVDANSWVVLFLEVRPNLLSGECERFLLEDVSQVGDVVLVEDEAVIENEFKMVGLETLVGYKVVTPGRRNIGKVRGYTFNINSGAIESLELDSFGISIIPSSLVSTYALLVEDVLEVVADAVVVHEAAASRLQRLTKGVLDSQKVGSSIDDIEEYSDFERPLRSEERTRSGTRKFRRRTREMEDDWELPLDYL